MIKTITKTIFACDMCGYEGPTKGAKVPHCAIVPKDVFEFTVNLADGAKNVQICPACQQKLTSALKDKLHSIYSGACCGCDERRKDDD